MLFNYGKHYCEKKDFLNIRYDDYTLTFILYFYVISKTVLSQIQKNMKEKYLLAFNVGRKDITRLPQKFQRKISR